jgi:hypothetical protein
LIEGEQDLGPEVSFGEEATLLANLVHQREFKGIGLINVSFIHEGKEALPTCEECIIKCWQPIQEKQLARISCKELKGNFCKN